MAGWSRQFVEHSEDLTLATTVTLPVIRGPAVTAKAAAAVDILSGGRLVLGVGPGSSPGDYAAAGIPFEQRWPRFDEAVRILRTSLSDTPRSHTGTFYDVPALEPGPARSVPIWIGSWGSPAGLRRAVDLGDGWLASAYNTSPERITVGREHIRHNLRAVGRDDTGFPTVIATMWTYVTDSVAEADIHLTRVARMLGRDPAVLAEQLLIGAPEVCAARLARYVEAGVAGFSSGRWPNPSISCATSPRRWRRSCTSVPHQHPGDSPTSRTRCSPSASLIPCVYCGFARIPDVNRAREGGACR
ncbi:LLM class flavin-dependent oxidoreductase [Gordonia sp. LSe1-13]|uniref:LLM class flavin-dependent oxidoreductase n=1 Tax=Gordonia sesuvii TaxID=3116777 RepID=A0ABU7MAS1_9ACTN|nr:LLM class flavin-dependent oxidoreductase [Gordonia sp. LSe1-13]